MAKKFGKERTLEGFGNFRVKYGTTNVSKFKSLYITIDSWVQPTTVLDYHKFINNLKRKVQYVVKDNLSNKYFYDINIVDLDLRSSGMTLFKKSFMNLEITLYPKSNDFLSEELRDSITNLVNKITNKLSGEPIICNKTKK
jgi:hypothetical protein